MIGRSHRASVAKARIAEVIERSKAILGMPPGWRLGVVPASDTGAVEMALWSALGPRGVDVLVWESFSKEWAVDIVAQLKVPDVRVREAAYGRLPPLQPVDPSRDVVFVWNGTASGVRLPHADFIADNRQGLAICDATSAAFAMHLPWNKLDVVTWSWQKALGGEGAHGMLALSPRAVARLEAFTPVRPLPKIFRLTKDSRLNEGIFSGDTINTPSMLCVEDALDGLRWAEAIGGLDALVRRSEANFAAVTRWIGIGRWADFLAEDPATRSTASICLKIVAPWFVALGPEDQAAATKELVSVLEANGVALDIAPYRDAPPGLRIWGGATVETSDIEALLPWLDWAFARLEAHRCRDMTKA